MINKMQNKMVTHILKAEVTREENLLLKIRTVQAQKKSDKRVKSKPKIIKNEVFEEYKFIATDNTLPTDKEEIKSSNTLNKKLLNCPENDIIKVTENAFINESKHYNNIYDEQNLNSRLSQQNELIYKSSREGNYDSAENFNEANRNNRYQQSSRSELMQKEFKDRSIEINQSSNSLKKSLNKSTSRSPKKMTLISLNPINEEKFVPTKDNNDILRRSSEILMRSTINKQSFEKRNTMNFPASNPNKGLLEPGSVRSSKIISFKDEMENQGSNQAKAKRKSQINNLKNNDYQGYKTTLNSNNSTKNKRKTSRDNTNTLNSNENLKSQQNLKNLKDDLIQGDYKTKIYNHESEKIINPNSAKNRSSIPRTHRAESFVKNRSKSEFNISVANKIIKLSDKEKAENKVDFDKNVNFNSSGNNFNKNDLKNLEKIIEINNSNSNINLNLNNSNLHKSEFLKEQNNNENEPNNFSAKGNLNIKDPNFDDLKDPNFIYNTNSNKNKSDAALNRFNRHQRINSVSGSVAVTNNLKNSRIMTNSRINTSNTDKKTDKKAKKISLISLESLKTDFIKYESESRKKSNLNSKRNSDGVQFENQRKSNRYSTVSTSNSKSRSKGHFNNLKNAFNNLVPNYNQNQDIDLNANMNKETKEHMEYDKLNINNALNNDQNNNRESKHIRFKSNEYNLYDNLNFNYNNEFDAEVKQKINNFYPEKTQNRNSADDFYKGNSKKEDYLELIASARESKREANILGSHFETFRGNLNENMVSEDKILNKNANENQDSRNNFYNKIREIKPTSTDRFRDLSPIRESEYSHDIYRKRDSNIERKYDHIDLYNKNTNLDKNKNEEIAKANFLSNKNEYVPNSTVVDYRNSKRAAESNYRIDDALSNFNNLYEFKNNKNSNFIYDEVNEKILPITSFEGESYPENLYREEKAFLRDNDIVFNRVSNNTNIKIEDNDSNRNLNYKSNEFSQTSSTFKKFTNSNLSTSKVKKSKKSESVFVPWDKVYKEKFREEFKNDLKTVPVAAVERKYRK